MALPVRIVLVDDHKIVRQGLRQMLLMAPDLEVVAEASNGQELLTLLGTVQCDVLLLDITMPGLSGVELIKRIALCEPAPFVLVQSMHDEVQLVSRVLKAGASGYLTKDSDPELLVFAIRKVARGGKYIDPMLVDEMVFDVGLDTRKPHERLSEREYQVFQLLVAGRSVTLIAEELSLSSKTVSTHKLRLMQKMHLDSIAALTRYAIDCQLLQR
ncbi:MAG: response regulator transcription factor [Pseudoxanthomonas sp.]